MAEQNQQTKQTNPIYQASAGPGRPADVTETDVIEAGEKIRERAGTVTATALRREIGRGRPERLKEIWQTHVEAEEACQRRRRALPAEIRDRVSTEVTDLSQFIEDIVSVAYENALREAEATVERQRQDLEARERAAEAETHDAYRLVEEADAREKEAWQQLRQASSEIQEEREARLSAEKRAAEAESLTRELRSQLAASKSESDDLRTEVGELRAFKQHVQSRANKNDGSKTAPTTSDRGSVKSDPKTTSPTK